jgi:hypothetical protein
MLFTASVIGSALARSAAGTVLTQLLLLVPAAFGWDSCQKKNWYKTIQSKLDDIKVDSEKIALAAAD